jgi:hypothetical protein
MYDVSVIPAAMGVVPSPPETVPLYTEKLALERPAVQDRVMPELLPAAFRFVGVPGVIAPDASPDFADVPKVFVAVIL